MRSADLDILLHEGEGSMLESDAFLSIETGGRSSAELGTRSVRRNGLIGDLLHRISFIEKAGTGIRRMREEAKKAGCPEPTFEANGFFTATFRPRTPQGTPQGTPQVTPEVEKVPHKYRTSTAQVTPHVTPQVTPQVEAVLRAVAETPKSRGELQKATKIKNQKHFRKGYMEPLVAAGWLAMTIPDKPRSSKQKYRTTELGLAMLRKRKQKK